jgi:hypothetical protein
MFIPVGMLPLPAVSTLIIIPTIADASFQIIIIGVMAIEPLTGRQINFSTTLVGFNVNIW